MGDGHAKAIGVIRCGVACPGPELSVLAGQHGYRLVFSVVLDLGPFPTALVVAQHLTEHAAAAVVVSDLAHIAEVRQLVTELAVLVTPDRVYSRGYRWPVTGERSC